MKLPAWHEVTAIFGGRFDPPHLGHREAVRGLFKNPGIRKTIIIPSASPPHKPTLASAAHRAEMTRLNFQSSSIHSPLPPEIEIDTREIRRSETQPNRPSYTYDTLQELRPHHRDLAFVLGTDQLTQFHTWYRFKDLLDLSHWIVLDRKPSQNLVQKTLQEWTSSGLAQAVGSNTWSLKSGKTCLILVETEAAPISSTEIRESIIKTGETPEGSVLPEVLAYLKLHRLYGI